MDELTQDKNNISDLKVNKEFAKILRKIARSYNLRCSIKFSEPLGQAWGEADCGLGLIWVRVAKRSTSQTIASIFFHELAHCLNYRDKKYMGYHGINDRKMTKARIRLFIRTGLRAERYTDKRGKSLMKKHLPSMDYIGYYDNEMVRDEYREVFLEHYRNKALTLKR